MVHLSLPPAAPASSSRRQHRSVRWPARTVRTHRALPHPLRAAKGGADGAASPPLPPPARPDDDRRLLIAPTTTRRAALIASGCAACQQLLLAYGASAASPGGPFERRRQAGVPRSSGIAFSYDREGADGPARWPGACNAAESRQQSPVDVAEGVLTTPASASCRQARLDFSAYRGLQRGVVVRNVGFGAEVRFPPGNFLRVVLPPAENGDQKTQQQQQQQQQQQPQQGAAEPSVRRLELLQYHFHEPGEHAVSGRRGAMEAHLVHRDPSGGGGGGKGGGGNGAAGLAVVAVLLDAADGRSGGGGGGTGGPQQLQSPPPPGQQGSASDALRALLETVPQEPGAEREVAYSVDPAWLVRDAGALGGVGTSVGMGADGASPSFFSYRGSLTTPPCGEGVEWFVLASRAAVVPAAQVRAFRDFARSLPGGVAAGGNARPLQPLNGRAVRFNCLGAGGGA